MTLFFDEDCGTGVPKALNLVGFKTDYIGRRKGLPFGTRDPEWLRWVGEHGMLAISCNKGILKSEAEREALIKYRAGCVFLSTGNDTSKQVLYLVLRKMDWLEQIHRTVQRPFAFILWGSGRKKPFDLMQQPKRA